MLGLGLNLGLTAVLGGGGGGGRDPLLAAVKAFFANGEQGYIHDLTDASTVFQERTGSPPATVSGAGGPIGSLEDLSPNSNWERAPSDAARPLWNAGGFGAWDGTNDQLTATFSGMNQPISRVSLIQMVNDDNSPRVFGDIAVAENGTLGCDVGASDQYAIYSGVLGNGFTQAVGQYFVAVERHNGNNSYLTKNNGTHALINAGTGNPTGLRIGANPAQTIFSNLRVVRVVGIARVLTEAEEAQAIAWCGSAFGLGAVLGDSTISQYFVEQHPVASFLTVPDQHIYDFSTPGHTIAQQQTAWLAHDYKSLTSWVIAEVGLNDLNPAESAATAIGRLQTLVNTVRVGLPTSGKILLSTLTPCRQWLIDQHGGVNGPIAYQKWLDINQAITNGGPTPITGVDARISSHTTALNDGSGNLAAAYEITGIEDHVHENDAGRMIIATAWDVALASLGF